MKDILEKNKDKFLAKTVETGGCLEWTSSRTSWKHGLFRFCYEGVRYRIRAHRASYILFIGDLPADEVVRHKCDNPLCVRPEHLERGTQEDNIQDMRERNRFAVGAANGRVKLTQENVDSIRAAVAAGASKGSQAKLYGVNKSTVKKIVEGTTWKSRNSGQS